MARGRFAEIAVAGRGRSGAQVRRRPAPLPDRMHARPMHRVEIDKLAYDADGRARRGAWVAELTGMFDLAGWPAGMRLIVRKERPTPARSCDSSTSTGIGSPRS
jgi:hypothetical protein